MTQQTQIQTMLANQPWVCGTEFLDAHLPRYGARLFELRAAGWRLRRRVCQRHRHRSVQYEWQWLDRPPQQLAWEAADAQRG